MAVEGRGGVGEVRERRGKGSKGRGMRLGRQMKRRSRRVKPGDEQPGRLESTIGVSEGRPKAGEAEEEHSLERCARNIWVFHPQVDLALSRLLPRSTPLRQNRPTLRVVLALCKASLEARVKEPLRAVVQPIQGQLRAARFQIEQRPSRTVGIKRTDWMSTTLCSL